MISSISSCVFPKLNIGISRIVESPIATSPKSKESVYIYISCTGNKQGQDITLERELSISGILCDETWKKLVTPRFILEIWYELFVVESILDIMS